MIFFLSPERLWHLLWLVPAMLSLFIISELRRKHAVKKLLGAPHFAAGSLPVGIDVSPAKRRFSFVLLLLTSILLVLAYARPFWGNEVIPFKGVGRDIVVALDLSKSMLCKDLQPSRLEHAKRFVEELSSKMRGDRFALVGFAGDAVLSCPLTFDQVSFRNILLDQTPGNIPLGGTDLERALKVAATAFDSKKNLGYYAIVLITDGGELTGKVAREAERLCAEQLPVVVVGVGDPALASPIPIQEHNGNTTYLKDKDGNIVNTRLEEEGLRELAAKTGGVYIHSTLTEMNVSAAATWLQNLTPGAQDESSKQLPIERWQWFLVPALLSFILFLCCGEAKKERKGMRLSAFKILLRSTHTLIFVSILLMTIPGFAQGATEKAEKDAQAPQLQDIAGTLKELSSAESVEHLYNAALKAQKEGNSKLALKLYDSVLASPNISKSARNATTHNIGVFLHGKAREIMQEAQQNAAVNLDEANKKTVEAEKAFRQAEDHYREVIRNSDKEKNSTVIKNQQILRNDLNRLKELRQAIEDLKKQIDQAKEDTAEAEQKQEEANNEQNPQKKEEKQKIANEAGKRAQESIQQMQEKAEQLKNESSENAASDASQEIQNAREEQQKGNGEKAQEHLRNAREILEREMQNQQSSGDNNSGQKGRGKDGEKNDQNAEQSDDEPQGKNLAEEPSEQQEEQKPKESDKDINDRIAVESILRDMAKEEAEWRKEILRHKNAKAKETEKDW